MRILTLLIFTTSMAVSARPLAQTVTLKAKNLPLEKIFPVVKAQTGYVFFSYGNLLQKSKAVTLDADQVPLQQFLAMVFRDQPLTYRIDGKTIFLAERPESGKPEKLVEQVVLLAPVRGRVTDASGIPLPGASVSVKGKKTSVATDGDGAFTLEAGEGDVLVITYIGYQTAEHKITGANLGGAGISIRLNRAEIAIQEIVINKGYYTEKKKLSTGSVGGVSAKDIGNQPVTNVLSALEGRVTGLFISQSTGIAAGGMNVEIRGVNSIAAGRNPLYIIDGVPFGGNPIDREGQGGYFWGVNNGSNPLNTLNPSDIASIDVLKDADATAIYGSRGANGVILITTKKGKAGEAKVDINISQGGGRVTRFIPMLNNEEYLRLRKDAFAKDGETPDNSNAPDLTLWDQTKGTDWQKEIIGNTASFTDASATLSGGDSRNKYLVSGTFHNETSVYAGDFHYRRGGLRFSFDHNSRNDKFGLSLMSFYNKDNNLMPAFVDPIMAYKLPANFPAYTPEGKLYYRDEYDNPYAWMLSKHKSNSNNLVANLTLKYTLMKGLDLKVSGGYNRIEMVQTITRPRPVLGGSSNLAIYTNNNNQSLILEPQISYTRSFGRSKVDFVGGGSYQESRFVMPYYIFATNYASDELLENVSSAGRINSITNSQSLYRYASGFGRLTYNWDDKYILNGVFRRDGSSRFAPGKQFGNFGSIGLAWVFSNEAFISSTLPWLSYGKIRGSYGSTGNDQITDYGYLDTYGPSVYPYGPTAGMMPTRVANPEFSWEVTKKLEAALELGFAKDRFMFTLNYFRNRSDNMLVGTPLTPQTGFSEFQSNFPALVQNKGIEIELNVKTMQKTAFSWNTSFNLTSLRNELASFPGLAESGFRDMYLIGQPLSMIALYEYAGLKDGIPEVTDKDGDKTPVPGLAGNGGGDLIAAGQTAPYFYGGFNNTLTYRSWSFDIFFQFVKQGGLHPRSSDPYMVPGLAFNQDAHMLRDGLRPTVNAGSPAYVAYEAYARSTAMLQDASYIRLKNLAISYNLKSAWLNEKGIDACRFFLRGQNLLTFTGYYGFDPETKALTLPPLKTATIGIQVTL